jgi:hypothetical protein
MVRNVEAAKAEVELELALLAEALNDDGFGLEPPPRRPLPDRRKAGQRDDPYPRR